jgi:hypothetical protein
MRDASWRMKAHERGISGHSWRFAGAGLVLAGLVLLVMPARAQQGAPAPSAAPTRDISGFWELSFDSRNVPDASLLPTVTRAKIEAHKKADAKAIRWCNLLGVPFTMDSGRPLDIRQGATAVIIVPENSSVPRYLYLNRSTHISDEVFDPSTVGDSIARWDGDTLVVDTVGFHPDRGITSIPGGGYRTASSHLVERYRLIKDGSILSVTSTWTDPKVFQKPHTYEFRYYRLPADYEPRQWLPCDPFDDVRAKFLEPVRPAKPAAPRPTAATKE